MQGYERDVEAITRVMQHYYHDAVVTELDKKVAAGIIGALREIGWVTPLESALLMLGERTTDPLTEAVSITVPVNMVLELSPGEWTIHRSTDRMNMAVTMTIRRTGPDSARPPAV